MRSIVCSLAAVGLLAGPAWAASDGLTLRAAIDLAVAHNLDLASNRLGYQEALWDLRATQDQYGPHLNLNSNGGNGVSRSGPSVTNQGQVNLALSQSLPTGGQYSIGFLTTASLPPGGGPIWSPGLNVSLSQPLLRKLGQGGEDLSLQQIAYQESKLNLEDKLLATVANTANAYWTLVEQIATLRLLQGSLKSRSDLVEANEAKVKAGLASQIEVVQATVNVKRLEAEVVGAQRQVENARDDLRSLIQAPASLSVEPLDTPEYTFAPISDQKALEVALAHRPDFLTSLLVIQSAQIQEEQANRAALPDVSAVANAGMQNSGPTWRSALSPLGNLSSYNWTVGLALDLPITRVSAWDKAEKAQLALQSAKVKADAARQELEIRVRKAVRNLNSDYKQWQVDRVAEDLANQQLDAEVRKLNLGLSTNFQVISYQNDRDSASLATIEALITLIEADVELRRLEGSLLNG